MKHYRYYDFVAAMFVAVLLLSNLLSSAKFIDFGFSILGLPVIFDAGTLVFPISYIFGDILTEVYGYKRARRVIWMGFFAMALMGFFVWLVGLLPGEAGWIEGGGVDAYNYVLGGVSALVIASVLGYWVGEFSNSYVLAKMKILTQGRMLWARTIGSTLVGQVVDTIIFFVVGALLGFFPPELLVAFMVSNYLFKVGIEVIFTPLTLIVVNWLKHAENEDYYDHDTDFNPFKLTSPTENV